MKTFFAFLPFFGISSYAQRKGLIKGLKMELPEDYGPDHTASLFFFIIYWML